MSFQTAISTGVSCAVSSVEKCFLYCREGVNEANEILYQVSVNGIKGTFLTVLYVSAGHLKKEING